MAGPFYVDDGGDGTTESSWATADTSINDLDAEYTFASGEIVYFGHDHVCQAVNVASLTIIGPTSGAPVLFISVTQGSSPEAYQASTTAQIDTSEAATYDLTFDGSFSLFGISVKSGRHIYLNNDGNEFFESKNSRLALGANGILSSTTYSLLRLTNTTIDLTQDGTTARTASVINLDGSLVINGLLFTNAGYRTGAILGGESGIRNCVISGADFSGFTNATTCEILHMFNTYDKIELNNCLTIDNPTFLTTTRPNNGGVAIFTNCGSANNPTGLVYRDKLGDVISTTAITRTGGGSIEGIACSLLITTEASVSEAAPFKTPWQHEKIASTGSKTFSVYITNDTADFTDAEVGLEVEFLGTTGEAIFANVSDMRTITTTAAAQTDDVTSTWNGAGPSYTYKQQLSVTATVNVAGMFRWRLCCGVASVASSRYFYADTKITVA